MFQAAVEAVPGRDAWEALQAGPDPPLLGVDIWFKVEPPHLSVEHCGGVGWGGVRGGVEFAGPDKHQTLHLHN